MDGEREKWDLTTERTENFSDGFTMSSLGRGDKRKRKHSETRRNGRVL
jgi:hypothetical protein